MHPQPYQAKAEADKERYEKEKSAYDVRPPLARARPSPLPSAPHPDAVSARRAQEENPDQAKPASKKKAPAKKVKKAASSDEESAGDAKDESDDE